MELIKEEKGDIVPSDTVKVITTGEVITTGDVNQGEVIIPDKVITTGEVPKVMNVVRLEKIKNINKKLFKRDKKKHHLCL